MNALRIAQPPANAKKTVVEIAPADKMRKG
jgi:hypothetical protein